MTHAEELATRLGNDGQNWTDADGLHLEEIALMQMGAARTYAARDYGRDGDDYVYVDGYQGSYVAYDPIRYQFPDGSAIVTFGDCWDIEGTERYTARGLETAAVAGKG